MGTLCIPTQSAAEQLCAALDASGALKQAPAEVVCLPLGAGSYCLAADEARRVALALYALDAADGAANMRLERFSTAARTLPTATCWGHPTVALQYDTFAAKSPDTVQQTRQRLMALLAQRKIKRQYTLEPGALRSTTDYELQSLVELALRNGFSAAVLDQLTCELADTPWFLTILPGDMPAGARSTFFADATHPQHGIMAFSLGSEQLLDMGAGIIRNDPDAAQRMSRVIRHERAHHIMNAFGRRHMASRPPLSDPFGTVCPFYGAAAYLSGAWDLHTALIRWLPPTLQEHFHYLSEESCDAIFLFQHARFPKSAEMARDQQVLEMYQPPAVAAQLKQAVQRDAARAVLEWAHQLQNARAIGIAPAVIARTAATLRAIIASVDPAAATMFDTLQQWFARMQQVAQGHAMKEFLHAYDPTFTAPPKLGCGK